jgi:hypothetical protein
MARRHRPVPPTAEEWLVRELDTLERPTLDGTAFAGRLSDVVRTFLERKSGIPATRLTTSEFLSAIESVDTADVIPVESVRTILEWCDRVKFAAVPATDEERVQRLAETRTLVIPEPSKVTTPGKAIATEPAG